MSVLSDVDKLSISVLRAVLSERMSVLNAVDKLSISVLRFTDKFLISVLKLADKLSMSLLSAALSHMCFADKLFKSTLSYSMI